MQTEVSLDFCSLPKINDEIESFFYEDIPTSTLLPRTGTDPICFEVKGIKNIFIDLNECYLTFKFKVYKRSNDDVAWENLPPGENICPINLFGYTFFSNIAVEFNHMKIEESKNGLYMYKAYMHILLNSNESMRKTYLSTALYGLDKSAEFDTINLAVREINPGSYYRGLKIDNSQEFQIKCKLLLDTFSVSRLLIPEVDINLSFYPNDPQLCLMSAATGNPKYAIQIRQANLRVGRIILKNKRNISKAVYPYLNTTIIKYPIETNVQELGPITLTQGVLPSRIIIAFTSQQAVNGKKIYFNILKI